MVVVMLAITVAEDSHCSWGCWSYDLRLVVTWGDEMVIYQKGDLGRNGSFAVVTSGWDAHTQNTLIADRNELQELR